jgi:hypothetical protein
MMTFPLFAQNIYTDISNGLDFSYKNIVFLGLYHFLAPQILIYLAAEYLFVNF